MEAHELFSNIVTQVDDGLADLVEGKMVDLNNTAIFFVSDHGQHTSPMYIVNMFVELNETGHIASDSLFTGKVLSWRTDCLF